MGSYCKKESIPKKMLMVLMILFLSKHPSTMCMMLVMFCIFMSLQLKSLISNIHIYIILIIFIGGILLLLFYLTMVSTNKPSWLMNFVLLVLFFPEFSTYKNLKFSSNSMSLEMLHSKGILMMILMLLIFMLGFMFMMFNKMSFMRQLN